MRRLTITASVLTASLATAMVSPAAADTTAFRDPRGDAPARYDLTTVRIINTPGRVSVKTRVRGLRGDRVQIFDTNISPVRSGANYMVSTDRRPNGRITAMMGGYDSEGYPIETRCKIVRKWSPARKTIRISFPTDCLQVKGAIRVSLYIGAGDGTAGDPVDWTKTVRVGQS